MKKMLSLGFLALLFASLCLILSEEGSIREPVVQEVFFPALEETHSAPETFFLLWETEEEVEPPTEYQIAPFEGLCQYPDFPTGCEATAAVSVLHFFGLDLSLGEFVDEYLEQKGDFELKGSILYGPSPYEYFIGSPRDASSFGCMAPPICKAMKKAAGKTLRITELRGMELETLCQKYVAKDLPVLVWVTMGMKEVEEGVVWTFPNGQEFIWPSGEHCMVLLGFDVEHYILMDPQTGTVKSFPKELVELRYQSLGMQAVVAIPIH